MPSNNAHLKLVPADASGHVSDLQLVAAVRKADPTVAGVFYDRVSPRIWSVLRRLLRGNAQDHEDLAQQTLISLVGSLDRYRGQAPLESWAGAIAGHVALDWLRQHRRDRALFESLTEASIERPSSDAPDRSVLSREVIAQLNQVLEGIGEDRLNTWVLHDVHGFSLLEIAEMTRASLAAAQSRLVRGRADVNARLAHEPGLVALLRQQGAP